MKLTELQLRRLKAQTLNLCGCGHASADHDVCSRAHPDYPCRHSPIAYHQKRCKFCWCAQLDQLPQIADAVMARVIAVPKAITKAMATLGHTQYYIWFDGNFDSDPQVLYNYTTARCNKCGGRRMHIQTRPVTSYEITPHCLTCYKGRLHYSKSPLSQYSLIAMSKNKNHLRQHIARIMNPLRRAA